MSTQFTRAMDASMSDSATAQLFRSQLSQHLAVLYPQRDASPLAEQILSIFNAPDSAVAESSAPAEAQLAQSDARWSEKDCLLITYADSILAEGELPLVALKNFLNRHCQDVISGVHVLPFYPFSSDDGFAVIDYTHVRQDLGSWAEIGAIGEDFDLMVDLVINHVSSQSQWFEAYCRGEAPYTEYFISTAIDDDLTQVVRPRTTPLLRPTETASGVQQVWCTFSHDQVDLNFASPHVLLDIMRIIKLYLEHGTKILRLDAIGYLWKEPGTTCIHLPQTHEVVRLIRTVCDYVAPGTIIVTETNVPNHENLSYFGNRNEAHAIYNFSLAPLLVHALLTGETHHLKRWIMSLPPAPDGCTYLNFTASHDGIGMRPAEGLLSDHEQSQLIETIRQFGGQFSTRQGPDGNARIYEINVSLFEALKGTVDGEDDLQIDRFLCSQTVMLGIEGLPAFYIHSLLATPNDGELLQQTGRARSINRHRWDAAQLEERLADPESSQSLVFTELKRRIGIRRRQAAFHPNATQFTLQFANPLFGFWRQSRDRSQSVFAIHNMSKQLQELRLTELNLIADEPWRDLISEQWVQGETMQLAPYQSVWISNNVDGV